MSLTRSAFSIASSALHSLSFVLALFALFVRPSLGFLGLLALSAIALVDAFGPIFADRARARARLAPALATAAGLAAIVGGAAPGGSAASVLGALGLAAYLARVLWAVRLEEAPRAKLASRVELPPFDLADLDGEPIPSRALRGEPQVFVFHRGVLSPRCMRMVAAFARAAAAFEARGAQLWVVSADSRRDAEDLARRLGGRANVAIDEGSGAARALGIAARTGAPSALVRFGFAGWSPRPTVIVTDARGVVRFFDQPSDARLRPSPRRALEALDGAIPLPVADSDTNSSLADVTSSGIEHVPLPSPKESS